MFLWTRMPAFLRLHSVSFPGTLSWVNRGELDTCADVLPAQEWGALKYCASSYLEGAIQHCTSCLPACVERLGNAW